MPSHDIDPEFLLVTGPPRTGTTFLMDWLQGAIPGEKLWLRESGVPSLIHHMLSGFDFERRNHRWGFDLVSDLERRSVAVRHIRGLALDLYQSYGEQQIRRIVDKEPYFGPDGREFYRHLQEVFPRLRLIATVRHPRHVLNSMLARKWGRGPFPRTNRISPFAHHVSDLENCISDLIPGGEAERTLHQTSPWSLRKCCVSYRNAIRNIQAAIEDGVPILLLNYEELSQATAVAKTVGSFLNVDLSCGEYRFQVTSQPRIFTPEEEQIIQSELIDTGAVAQYQQQAARATAQLAP